MKLNPTQEKIVTSKADNIIVSAGAGSGKTRVLTERVKYLIENGVEPSSIVCITFTNRAANEMRERLPGANEAFIGTIHSFANHILKDSGKRYGLLTADKEVEIIHGLIDKYAQYTTHNDYTNYIKIQNLKKLGHDYNDIDIPSPMAIQEIRTFYEDAYPENLHTICARDNIITFDKLITECTEYFKKTGGHIGYLLVDEFQDIGMNEYEFIMALNAEHNFMVGDDWQSIYGFKGGDVQIFLTLMQSKDWTPYYLSTNYRNSREILATAKLVIHQASDIIHKQVRGARTEDGGVYFGSKYDLKHYLKYIKQCHDYKSWFILARTNKEIQYLSKELKNAQIPFQTFKQGGLSTAEISEIMNSDTVKLLTIHASKGLENKKVLIYGDFEVKPPKYKKINSEERKIFYVAITRAMDELIILS